MSLHSPSQAQFAYNPATPPLPPPKPSAQSSGSATPQPGPPRPPPPPGQELGTEAAQHSSHYHAGQTPSDQQQYILSAEPVPEGWLPDIVKNKTTSDLQALLQDQALQQALIHNPTTTHPSVTASTTSLESMLAANIALANALKALEQQILLQRQSTQQRLLSLRALERQFRAKQTEQDAALQDFSAPSLYQKLTGSIAEQESLCKGLEESFLDEDKVAADREVEMFVKRVKEARKVAWLRSERKERWDEGRVGGWR